MKKKIAYIGCPYSGTEEVMGQRFEAVSKVAGDLINKGEIIFSPISMCHPIAKFKELPRGWDYWEQVDRAFLECCYKMYVLMLDGWEESAGLLEEIKIAEELGFITSPTKGYYSFKETEEKLRRSWFESKACESIWETKLCGEFGEALNNKFKYQAQTAGILDNFEEIEGELDGNDNT